LPRATTQYWRWFSAAPEHSCIEELIQTVVNLVVLVLQRLRFPMGGWSSSWRSWRSWLRARERTTGPLARLRSHDEPKPKVCSVR
jgi:hypothetical protein